MALKNKTYTMLVTINVVDAGKLPSKAELTKLVRSTLRNSTFVDDFSQQLVDFGVNRMTDFYVNEDVRFSVKVA